MKPKTELALRRTPYVVTCVATVGATVAMLATVIAHAATGDFVPLLFLVIAAVLFALFFLLMVGLDALGEWNKARIAELEMEIRLNSSDDGNGVA